MSRITKNILSFRPGCRRKAAVLLVGVSVCYAYVRVCVCVRACVESPRRCVLTHFFWPFHAQTPYCGRNSRCAFTDFPRYQGVESVFLFSWRLDAQRAIGERLSSSRLSVYGLRFCSLKGARTGSVCPYHVHPHMAVLCDW